MVVEKRNCDLTKQFVHVVGSIDILPEIKLLVKNEVISVESYRWIIFRLRPLYSYRLSVIIVCATFIVLNK